MNSNPLANNEWRLHEFRRSLTQRNVHAQGPVAIVQATGGVVSSMAFPHPV